MVIITSWRVWEKLDFPWGGGKADVQSSGRSEKIREGEREKPVAPGECLKDHCSLCFFLFRVVFSLLIGSLAREACGSIRVSWVKRLGSLNLVRRQTRLARRKN